MEYLITAILAALYFTRFGVLVWGLCFLFIAVKSGMLLFWVVGVFGVCMGVLEVIEYKEPRPAGRKPTSASRS